MMDIEGHLFRTSGRKGLKGRKGRFDSSTARDDASGTHSEMKSSLKSGRPLRPDVLNHDPYVPQISPRPPRAAFGEKSNHGMHGNRLRRTRKAIGNFRFAHPSPLRPRSIYCGRIASIGPEGKFSNCFPRPAKRASACSVVKPQRRPAVTQSKAIPWARESKIWYNMNQRATQKN